jgi:Protein of unknown function (DUF2934)
MERRYTGLAKRFREIATCSPQFSGRLRAAICSYASVLRNGSGAIGCLSALKGRVMDREKRIQEIAYSIWVAEGFPVGQDDRHWRMTTQMLKQEEEKESRHAVEKSAEEKKPDKNA